MKQSILYPSFFDPENLIKSFTRDEKNNRETRNSLMLRWHCTITLRQYYNVIITLLSLLCYVNHYQGIRKNMNES